MNRLSIWSKTNLMLSFIFLLVGLLAPILIEKFSYNNKMVEAQSVSATIANSQHNYYTTKNQYIPVKKSNQATLTNQLNIRKDDLKYYDYTVMVSMRSFQIVAEPKIQFLRSRAVPPKIYTYSHTLNGTGNGSWSSI